MRPARAYALLAAVALTAAALFESAPGPIRLVAEASSLAFQSDSPFFEVASIKVNDSGSRQVNMNWEPGGRFTAVNVSLETLISVAYGDRMPLPKNRLSIADPWIGGGDYLASAHFDVVAKADGNPSQDQLPRMLQRLLAERFKLVVHRDVKDLPIYSLVMARSDGRLGPRLRRSNVDCTTAASDRSSPPSPAALEFTAQPCSLRTVPGRAAGRAVTMQNLARNLGGLVDDHRVVEDRTGLEGNFDLDLEWTPSRPVAPDAPPLPPIDPNGPALFTALREQLGLRLQPAKNQIDILVVDHAEKPTAD